MREVGGRRTAPRSSLGTTGIGRSGKTMDRADVDAALERIRAGQTDGVIVAWLDRFSRAPVPRGAGRVRGHRGGRRARSSPSTWRACNPADATGEMALTVHARGEPDAMAQDRRALRADAARGDRRRARRSAVRRSATASRTRRRRRAATASSTPAWSSTMRKRRRSCASFSSARRPARPGWNWRAGSTRSRRSRTAAIGPAAPSSAMIALPDLPRRGPPRQARQRRRPTSRSSAAGALASRAEQARSPDPARHLPAHRPRAVRGCGRRLRGSALGRKPRNGRKASPPRVYTCDTAELRGARPRSSSTASTPRSPSSSSTTWTPSTSARWTTPTSTRPAPRSSERTMRSRRWPPSSQATRRAVAAHQAALEAAEQRARRSGGSPASTRPPR